MSTTSADHNRAISSPTILANYSKVSTLATTSVKHSRGSGVSPTLAKHSRATISAIVAVSNPATVSANHRNTRASITSANQNRDTSSPTVNVVAQNNNRESSVLCGIMAMPHRLLKTLQGKFQEELIQTERELEEKENALICTRQRISEAEERRQRLLKELEETWNQIIADTQEEGVIQAEIAAKKRD